MQIICVSRGSYGRGQELAERLAEKMGYECLGREDLIEAATREGIQVGKLEMAMIKPHAFSEKLARERDHYLAFARNYLCERAVDHNLVYHGRTGHMLVPGVSHVLRVRVVWDLEHRVQFIMSELGVDREKALRYVKEVDEDRERWVRHMYGVGVGEALNYDVTVNLQQIGVENAAAVMVQTAQLPDFQMTPSSRQRMEDLLLGSRARLALARDDRTYAAGLKVRADSGLVTVSYLPPDASVAGHIPDVLDTVEGIDELSVTMATSNLLWIQERFEVGSEAFNNVVEIATKWNAAVELLRLAPSGCDERGEPRVAEPATPMGGGPGSEEYNGGIEPDTVEVDHDDGGLRDALDELARLGRSGGGKTVCGTQQRLVETVDRSFPYTLVVIGDLFLSKGHAARIRAMRDLRAYLGDRLRVPIVASDELGSQYLFGPRDAVRVAAFLAVVVVLYLLVFTNQEAILAFLAHTGWYAEAAGGGEVGWAAKILVSVAVFLFIPVVAFSYGRVTSGLLKLIKME